MSRRYLKRYRVGTCVVLVGTGLAVSALWQHRNAIAQSNPLPSMVPNFLVDPNTVDNSALYRAATDAMPGGTRDTLPKWKTQNGFSIDGTRTSGEATAIYFNNGDLKFGRDMHCRVTNVTTKATACYVSNFGIVGTDDAPAALTEALAYEASHQDQNMHPPAATVAMEYDPTVTDPLARIQFWAYTGDGNYLALPVLDTQNNKPMPHICTACHQGNYFGGAGNKVTGAVFLPFDLDTFLDINGTKLSMSNLTPAVQQQFNLLNKMVYDTNPPSAVQQLIQFWYGDITNPTAPFAFNQGAAQLPGAPFAGREELYDKVVKVTCRSCHIAMADYENWTSFGQMLQSAGSIQRHICYPIQQSPQMPRAQIPWINFWQQGLSDILASQLNLSGGCPPN
jgi:hypothetical protein